LTGRVVRVGPAKSLTIGEEAKGDGTEAALCWRGPLAHEALCCLGPFQRDLPRLVGVGVAVGKRSCVLAFSYNAARPKTESPCGDFWTDAPIPWPRTAWPQPA
jgi:hypothetical protein